MARKPGRGRGEIAEVRKAGQRPAVSPVTNRPSPNRRQRWKPLQFRQRRQRRRVRPATLIKSPPDNRRIPPPDPIDDLLTSWAIDAQRPVMKGVRNERRGVWNRRAGRRGVRRRRQRLDHPGSEPCVRDLAGRSRDHRKGSRLSRRRLCRAFLWTCRHGKDNARLPCRRATRPTRHSASWRSRIRQFGFDRPRERLSQVARGRQLHRFGDEARGRGTRAVDRQSDHDRLPTRAYDHLRRIQQEQAGGQQPVLKHPVGRRV